MFSNKTKLKYYDIFQIFSTFNTKKMMIQFLLRDQMISVFYELIDNWKLYHISQYFIKHLIYALIMHSSINFNKYVIIS